MVAMAWGVQDCLKMGLKVLKRPCHGESRFEKGSGVGVPEAFLALCSPRAPSKTQIDF